MENKQTTMKAFAEIWEENLFKKLNNFIEKPPNQEANKTADAICHGIVPIETTVKIFG